MPAEGEFDLNRHYFSVSPWAFRLAASYTGLAGVADLLVPNEQTTPPVVVIILTSALLLLSFNGRPAIHKVTLTILGAMLVLNAAVGTR